MNIRTLLRKQKKMPSFAFLHVAKTGGTTMEDVFRRLRQAGYAVPARLPHDTELAALFSTPGLRLSVILRDPLERIVSGFNSRLRQGRPMFNNQWTAEEAAAFGIFPSVRDFLRARISDDHFKISAAHFAANHILHIKRGYQFYFESPEKVFAYEKLFYFIGDINDMRAAAYGILSPFDVPQSTIDNNFFPTHVASAPPAVYLSEMSPDETHRLRVQLAGEYAVYNALCSIRDREI